MVKINKLYLDRFKLIHHEYLYPVSRGIYLAFDEKTLDYIGIELFYLADPKKYNPLVEDKISQLLCNNVLELKEGD